MLIGKPGAARTAIAMATAPGVEVRGRDLAADLMGRMTFTGFFFFLITGHEATETQRFFLDLMLVAIAEHGLTPSAVAARMTYAAAPDALQGAVAAGILGAGGVILGASELCAAMLTDAMVRIDASGKPDSVVADIAKETHSRGEKLPGFGHPIHKPVDVRAERILALADEKKVSGRAVDLARRFVPAAEKEWGRKLPMNVSMAIAACLIDVGFPPAMTKAVPILARTAGLLAHLAEEKERPTGFLMASAAEGAVAYDGDKP